MILSCVTQHVCLYRMLDTGTTKCVCLACQIHNKLYLYNTQTTKCIYLQVKVMDIQTCIQDKVTHMHAQQNVCLYRTKSCTYRPVYRTVTHMHAQQNVRCYRTKSCTYRHVYMYTYRTKSHTCTKNVSLQVTYNKMHVYTRHTHAHTCSLQNVCTG